MAGAMTHELLRRPEGLMFVGDDLEARQRVRQVVKPFNACSGLLGVLDEGKGF